MPPPQAAAAAPVVLNIFLGGAAPPTVQMHSAAPPHTHAESSIEGYHLAFDENGIPHNHSEMLWGDYIDKQGRPAVGYHSHDPASGNAQ
jgi:hypothetical protein